MMHISVLIISCLLFGYELVLSASESEANNPVFNLDHTALEKNIAAIFNKVAHSSATTKRSVPAYEAQVSQSTIHSTSPSSTVASLTTLSTVYPMIIYKTTSSPILPELPSYAPPSRATPPLPPEYSNPFADKPTLRGTNIDAHLSIRRPIPPPSHTPAHERIPIKPPDLIEEKIKNANKDNLKNNKIYDSVTRDPLQMSDREKDLNDTIDIPSLHYTSISRILSGSNGRKQDIPEILLKPISTKPPSNQIITKLNQEFSTLVTKSTNKAYQTSTLSSTTVINSDTSNEDGNSNNYKNSKNIEPYKIDNFDIVNTKRFSYSQPPSTVTPSGMPYANEHDQSNLNLHSLESTWKKIAWSSHVYLTASMFTLIALYSVYKIVRFNNVTNLLSQSYFLSIHMLLTIVCTLRCFYLFYHAYNLGKPLPKTLLEVLMFVPSSLLAAAFATLILYMSRCSTAPSLSRNKFSSPAILIFVFIIHITVCASLHISNYVFGYSDESRIFPLICKCIYIVICVTLGLCYMYVYRVIRSHLLITNVKSVSSHISTDFTTTTLNTAITTTIATALLFIIMGFVQLYGIFGIREVLFSPSSSGVTQHIDQYSWLRWGLEFSIRLIELSLCGLLAWVASLSHYHLREKQIQQHVHSGFALFPCGSSTSTENMDDALYPAICSTNQAIQNYTIRTGKHVYDDSFPLNTLPENANVSNTLERHCSRKTGTLSNFVQEKHDSYNQRRNDSQSHSNSEDRNKLDNKLQNVHEHSSASGSTMLVAEDGFVRFRNLGPEGDELSDIQNTIRFSNERKSSTTCNDRLNAKHSSAISQVRQNYHQNPVSQLHLSVHRSQHQIYNNT